ncbi:MAG: zinc ribbon domain-containing protein [Cognatishimia sp.]
MPNLEKGTVVAECSCNGCGKPVKVKLNKNSIAYYYCPWTNGDGERCNHKESWGRSLSQEMQRNYLAARKQTKTNHDEVKADEPTETPGDGTGDAAIPEQPSAGDESIFGAFG